MSKGNELWGRRLKETRTAVGLSQKQLGILAGLDQFVAGTRINRYELGVHKADFQIAQRLAEILNIPTGYFFTEDDQLALLMLAYHRMSQKKKHELTKLARKLMAPPQTS
ncbi:helix-turn-helix domain-containing protein [Oxalobacteraceae bacterium OTU3CAMAD1]|jgi:transcriptional regulator with XRE-family HTH domain|nr:helix-turn-helix domain-containing protein [Oxalobacteraceae bacterium OTU3CAMAD1]